MKKLRGLGIVLLALLPVATLITFCPAYTPRILHRPPGLHSSLRNDRAVLDRLQAPHKELVWFEHSAHIPFFEEPERFTAEMRRVKKRLVGKNGDT